MTNLIEKLAVQSLIEHDGELIFSKEKFTELIVQKCVEVCKSRAGNADYNTGRMHCASDIAECFGLRRPGANEPKMGVE